MRDMKNTQSPDLFPYEIQDTQAVSRALNHLPCQDDIAGLAAFYKVMADPTRLRLLTALESGPLCATDLANVVQMSRSAVSHQLKALKDAHLVRGERDGKTLLYSLDDDHVASILCVTCEHLQEGDK